MPTIDLTERELIMILDCVGNRIEDLHDCASFGDAHLVEEEIHSLGELETDLREALARHDDGWGDDWNDAGDDALPLAVDVEINAETQFVDAGIVAREMLKERHRVAFADSDMRTGSLAAQRQAAQLRVERMMLGTVTPFIEEE